ncbi:uncharacterized protein LOC117609407 [Osmia lignaria lignaria]|uniref:uncharacterized protein LOC117609407 n=1 Tax=Osmia lignaria lignaria TaxID=1437193 RepID=UPI00402B9626
MKLKGTVKRNRGPFSVTSKSKTSPMISNIHVVTENVLLPVTKTIFTKCHSETNRSKRHVKLVKPSQSNDNVIGPLLKSPSNIPGKTYASTLLRVEQSKSGWNSREKKFLTNERSKPKESQRQQQRTELPFPCPISIQPVTVTRTAVSPNRSIKKSSKLMERKESQNQRNVETSKKSLDLLALSNTSTTNTTASSNIFSRYSLISYCDSALMKIALIDQVKQTLSSNVIDRIKESSRCLVDSSTSNGFLEAMKHQAAALQLSKHVKESSRCLVDSSTSNSILETMKHQAAALQLSKHSPQNLRRNTADRSTFTLLVEDQSRWRCEDTYSPRKEHPCKIKYSWQVVGKGSQTSRTLLESIIKANSFDDESIHQCAIKYSWQIIGMSTQTSKRDFAIAEGHPIASFSLAKIKRPRSNVMKASEPAQTVTVWRNGKRFILLNNQCTQTIAHKTNQTTFLEIHKKSY